MVVKAPVKKLEAHLFSDGVQSWRAESSNENTFNRGKPSEWKGKLQMMQFRTCSLQMWHVGILIILNLGSLKTAEVGRGSVVFVYQTFVIFCGVNHPRPQMTCFWIQTLFWVTVQFFLGPCPQEVNRLFLVIEWWVTFLFSFFFPPDLFYFPIFFLTISKHDSNLKAKKIYFHLLNLRPYVSQLYLSGKKGELTAVWHRE